MSLRATTQHDDFEWMNYIRTVHNILLKLDGDLSLPVFLIGPIAFLVCICPAWSTVCNVVDEVGAMGASIPDSIVKILKIGIKRIIKKSNLNYDASFGLI